MLLFYNIKLWYTYMLFESNNILCFIKDFPQAETQL